MKYFMKGSFIIISFFCFGCTQYNNNGIYKDEKEVIAKIEDEKIYIDEIDSIIRLQQYQLRLNALEIVISRRILEMEAKRKSIPLKELIENEINQKCESVSLNDFHEYISQLNSSNIDTANIFHYLEIIHQKDRQQQYSDSLKQYYSIKIKYDYPYLYPNSFL